MDEPSSSSSPPPGISKLQEFHDSRDIHHLATTKSFEVVSSTPPITNVRRKQVPRNVDNTAPGASIDSRSTTREASLDQVGTLLTNNTDPSRPGHTVGSQAVETVPSPPLGSPTNTNRRPQRPGVKQRYCGKCGEILTGQFVRALGGTYHLDCFTCQVTSRKTHHGVHCALTLYLGLRQSCGLEVLSRWRST